MPWEQRHAPHVEEADLKETEERQRQELGGGRIENGTREVEPQSDLDQRLADRRLPVPLADPVIAGMDDTVLRRAYEMDAPIEQGTDHCRRVVDREADSHRHDSRDESHLGLASRAGTRPG